jgi:small subunit ribosomal protein S20
MANIPSQKKRILRAERERLENRRYTSKIRTYFHRLEGATDATAREAEHRILMQTIDKAVKRGAIHRNTGARKKSRTARILHSKEAGRPRHICRGPAGACTGGGSAHVPTPNYSESRWMATSAAVSSLALPRLPPREASSRSASSSIAARSWSGPLLRASEISWSAAREGILSPRLT